MEASSCKSRNVLRTAQWLFAFLVLANAHRGAFAQTLTSYISTGKGLFLFA